MDSEGLRQRLGKPESMPKENRERARRKPSTLEEWSPLFHLSALISFFVFSSTCLHFQQILGLPLYFYSKDWYYSWQAMVKQFFGLLLVSLTDWWNPINVRLSGDKSIAGQIVVTPKGRVKLKFPKRTVVISNHQLYTDWVYMWFCAYAAKMHGHIFIILKQSLKFLPLIGPGMMLFSFIFLSRNWTTDKPRFQHRLRKLKQAHGATSEDGARKLDPMWLLLFPEGTTLCANGRRASASWARKQGVEDLAHTLLPRSRGMLYCLEELAGTVDWVYDCTLSYEGIPHGQYGQDHFTMRRIYLDGRGPRAVHMHWRRFALADIPLADPAEFDAWLVERWREKDALLAYFAEHACFPGEAAALADADPAAAAVEPAEAEESAAAPVPETPLEVAEEKKEAQSLNGAPKTSDPRRSSAGRSPARAARAAPGAAPAAAASPPITHVDTRVAPDHPLELLQIFVALPAVPVVWRAAGHAARVARLAVFGCPSSC